MRNQIASEVRKLTTTRSVYAMLAGLCAIVAVWRGGDRHGRQVDGPASAARAAGVPARVADDRAAVRPPARAPIVHRRVPVRLDRPDAAREPGPSPGARREARRDRRRRRRALARRDGDHDRASACRSWSPRGSRSRGRRARWRSSSAASSLQPCCGPRSGSGSAWRFEHQVAAIAGTLVWLLAAEGILSGLVPDVAKFFPGAAGFAIVGINPADLLTPASRCACCSAATRVVAVATGAVLMQRRDIA